MKFIKTVLLLLLSAGLAKAQLSVNARVDHLNPDGIDSLGNIFLDVSGSTGPYTYSWVPGAVSTSSLLNIPKNQYTVKVKSASNDSLTYSYNVGYKVSWTNVEGYFGNDTLRGDACSKNTLLPNTDGWMEYVVSASYGYHYYMGFTDSLSPVSDLSDIDFGIFSYAGIYLYAYENGSTVLLSSQNTGDVVRIERKGDTINYKINEVLMRSVVASGTSSKTFKLRANINTPLGIANVGCSFMHTGGVVFNNYIKVKPVIVHSSTASSSNGSISVFPNLAGAYSYTWQPGAVSSPGISSLAAGTYTALVQDSLANQSTYQYTVGYKTKWTNVSGTFNHDTLRGNASSKNSLLPNTNGWMQYVVSNSYGYHYYMGFTDSLSLSGDVNDIDFGIYSYAGLYLYAFEHGYATFLSSQNTGDIIRIERKGDTVNYKINEVLMRSVVSSGASSKTLKLRANINTPLGMADVGASFIDTNNVTFPNYLGVYPSIIHSSGPGISNGSITAISENIGTAYTYTWNPGSTHGASVTNKNAGNYGLTVADTALNKSNYHYNIGYKVRWTNLDGCTLSHDTLASTGALNWATAVSKNVLHASTNGWFEYVVQSTGDYKPIGFTDSISPIPQNFYDVSYGVYQSASTFYLLAHHYLYPLAYVAKGDVVRIERTDYQVIYKLNGIVLASYTDSTAYRKDWRLKVAVYGGQSSVHIGCSFTDSTNTSFPNYVRLYPSVIHSSGPGINDGSVSALRKDTAATYTYTWSPGSTSGPAIAGKGAGNYGVTVKDTAQNQSNYHYNIGYKTKWVNLDNCSLSHDTLLATGGGWCTAVGKNVLPAGIDGWFEYVVQNTGDYKPIGLTDSISSIPGDYFDIYYGIYQTTSNLYYLSHGYLSLLAYVEKGDVVRIERANYLVSYKLNGVTLYSVADTASYNKDWRLKTAIYPGQSDVNIGCSFASHIDPVVTSTDYTDSTHMGQFQVSIPDGTAPFNVKWNDNKFPAAQQVYHDLVSSYPGISVDSAAFIQNIDSIKQKLSYNGLEPGLYPITAYDAGNDSVQTVVLIEGPAVWTYTTGISIDTCHIGLKKRDDAYYMYGRGRCISQSGTYSAGNHFAISGNTFDFDVANYMSFSVPTNTNVLYVGLRQNDSLAAGDTSDISAQAMFRFNGNGTFNIVFNGASIYSGAVANGDFFSLSNDPETAQIQFFQNERFLAERNIASLSTAGGMQAKLILGSIGASIGGIKIIVKQLADDIAFKVTDVTCGNPASGVIMATGSSPLTTVPIKYELYDQANTLISTNLITSFPNTVSFTGLNPGTYTVKYYYRMLTSYVIHTVVKTVNIGYQPGWTDVVDVTVAPADHSLTRNLPYTGNAGAFSVNILNASATGPQWLEWGPSSSKANYVIGLSHTDPNQSSATINYGIFNFIAPTWRLYGMLHNGVPVLLNAGAFNSSFAATDKFMLEKTVTGSTYNVNVKVNNIIKGQFAGITNQDLFADATVLLGTINHPRMSFDCQSVICDPADYVVLHKKLDGGYYTTCGGQLHFTLDGDYSQGPLNYTVYNTSRTVMTGLSISNSVLNNGDNRYILDVNSLSIGYYVLEVLNQKKEKLTLRFKK